MKDYGIQTRQYGWHNISSIIIDMTKEMNDILKGALLGDGHLRKCGVNANFYYCSKSYQHVEFVCDKFMQYCTGQGIRYRNRYDKRTNKCYECYEFSSISSPTFTEEHDKWYKDGIKHIPDDLILTPLMCKIWYLGDGSLINVKNANYQRLCLYTNAFLKDEIEKILICQLKEFNPTLIKMDKNKNDGTGYAICIGEKDNIKKFINYIGECPFEDYSYKWEVKETLNKNLKEHWREFQILYLNGVPTTQISEIYKCSSTSVSNILKEHNVNLNNYHYQRYKEWIQLYKKGNTPEKIANEFNVNINIILKYIKYYINLPDNIKKNIEKINGVQLNKNKWNVYITIDRNLYYLGRFDTYEEACLARLEYENNLYLHIYQEWLKEEAENEESDS